MAIDMYSWISWVITTAIILSGLVEYLRRERRHRERLRRPEQRLQPSVQTTGAQLWNMLTLVAAACFLMIALWWFLQNTLYIPGWLDVSSTTIAVALTPLLVVVLLMIFRDLASFRRSKGRLS